MDEKKKNELVSRDPSRKVANGKIRKKGISGLIGKPIINDEIDSVVKRSVLQIGQILLNTFIYGDSSLPRSSGSSRSQVSYDGYYGGTRRERPTTYDSVYDYERIEFFTDEEGDARAKAEDVLMSMFGVLDEYPYVRVSDLYDFANITNNNPQTTLYGWTHLRDAKTVPTFGGGYRLKLPRAVPLKTNK